MKKKILLTLLALVLLTGITFFISNRLDIFTVQDIKDISISRAKSIPVLENYLLTSDENNRLDNELKEIREYSNNLQNQNEELLKEMEQRDRLLIEYQEFIEDLERDLDQAIFERDDYETKVSRLADVYTEMDEQRAANILTELEMDLVIDILDRMRERDVANILEVMETDFAAQISTRLSN